MMRCHENFEIRNTRCSLISDREGVILLSLLTSLDTVATATIPTIVAVHAIATSTVTIANMPSKGDYEPIPDVEQKSGDHPAITYPGLPENQAELMANMDAAIATASFSFEMPLANPEDLKSQGLSYIQSIIEPTLASLLTFAGGYFASAQAQYSSFAMMTTQAFPYINAVIVFLATARPLSKRCHDAVKPIFDKTDKIQEDVTNEVGNITKQVDTTVDTIQAQVVDALQPLQATIDEASEKAAPLKAIAGDDFDIPDTKDIDEEFDELQGKVGAKVEEAKKHLDFDQYIPYVLQSSSNFYYYVIVPVLVLALLLQLAVAFATAYASQQQQSQPQQLEDPTINQRSLISLSTTRYLRGSPGELMYTSTRFRQLIEGDVPEALDATMTDAADKVGDVKDEASAQLNGAADEAQGQFDAAKDEASDQYNAAKDEVQAQVDAAKDEASAQYDAAKGEAQAQLDAAKDEAQANVDAAKEQVTAAKEEAEAKLNAAKEEAQAQADAAKEQVTEQFDAAKEQANQAKEDALAQAQALEDEMKAQKEAYEQQINDYKDQLPTIILSVVTSYIMSLLQMWLLFLVTSPKVKAYIINMFMKKVNAEVDRVLREYGVTTAMEDVMGTRLARIRKKLLKLFNTVGKIQSLLEKIPNIPGMDAAMDSAKDAVGNVMGKLSSKKKGPGSRIGKFFK